MLESSNILQHVSFPIETVHSVDLLVQLVDESGLHHLGLL